MPEGIRSIDSEISKSRRQVKSNWSFSFFLLIAEVNSLSRMIILSFYTFAKIKKYRKTFIRNLFLTLFLFVIVLREAKEEKKSRIFIDQQDFSRIFLVNQ